MNSHRSNNQDDEDLRTKLSFIFTYYCTFGERTNSKYLKSHKFHKMMIDSGIKNELDTITTTRLDLLFSSETKNQNLLNLDQFLNFIPKLAIEKYPNLDLNKAFKKLIETNLLSLALKIMKDSNLGAQRKRFFDEIDESTIKVLEYVAPILYKIYIVKQKYK